MKKKTVIDSHVNEWMFGISIGENGYEVIGRDFDCEAAAKELNCSLELVEAVKDNLNCLRESIHDDLVDLYNKIEQG